MNDGEELFFKIAKDTERQLLEVLGGELSKLQEENPSSFRGAAQRTGLVKFILQSGLTLLLEAIKEEDPMVIKAFETAVPEYIRQLKKTVNMPKLDDVFMVKGDARDKEAILKLKGGKEERKPSKEVSQEDIKQTLTILDNLNEGAVLRGGRDGSKFADGKSIVEVIKEVRNKTPFGLHFVEFITQLMGDEIFKTGKMGDMAEVMKKDGAWKDVFKDK